MPFLSHYRRFSILVIFFLGIVLFPQLTFAQGGAGVWTVAIDDVDKPLLVALPTTQLLRIGCIEPKIIFKNVFGDPAPGSIQYPSDYWHVKSVDPNSKSKLDNWGVGVFCPLNVTEGPTIQRAKISSAVTDPLYTTIITIQNSVFEVTAGVGLWLMNWAGKAISFMLGQSNYINHPYVQIGWPFLQGIANVGFLLALLFIAAATTLQLEDWSFRKALPRLLIAVLLINFSLVVAAIFIDSSRVLMAIMTTILGGPNLDRISAGVIQNSAILNGLLDASGAVHAPGNYSWTIPLALLQANILIYALSIGMVLIAAALFMRHIILILLLIFSPLAYLALAFPNTKSWASKWWSEFLKWVFYGPVLLFFLLLVTVTGSGFNLAQANEKDPLFASILQIALTSGLLIIGYKTGRSFAGSMGAAAIDFTTKWGKALPGMAYRNPGKTAAIAASLAVGGGLPGLLAGAMAAGGVALGKRGAEGAYLQARDFIKPIKKTLYKGAKRKMPFGGLFFGPERDEKGKLLKGEDSTGAQWGRRISAATGLYDKGTYTQEWEDDMRKAGKTFNDVRTNVAYSRFDVNAVGTAMKSDQATAVIDTALDGDEKEVVKDFNRLWDMVRNPYSFNNIGEKDRVRIAAFSAPDIINEINKKRTSRGKAVLSADETSRLDRLIRDIRNSARSSRTTVAGDDWV